MYLPAGWAEDEERCLLRHVPDEIGFAIKAQLAAVMLQQTRDMAIAARWFAGDADNGGLELRRTARSFGFDYALAVKADHRVTTGPGRFTVAALAAKVPAGTWMRMRTGHGLKGDRRYDWALIDVRADDAPAEDADGRGQAVAVVRRHRYTGALSFYRYHSTTPVSLADLVDIICIRRKIEEDFQGAKGHAGLGQGQVTCWNSWMRWSLISLLAAAVLAVTHARSRTADQLDAADVLAVLRVTVIPAPRCDLEHVLLWSAWRRHHQYEAAACHQRWNNVTAEATS